MGCLIGGHLAKSGHRVVLVDVWQAHVDKINRDGLTLVSGNGSEQIPVQAVTDSSQISDTMDLLIVFVKSYHTWTAINASENLIGERTRVLTLQNGAGNAETIAEFVPKSQVLAGTTAHGANIKGPGEVIHAGKGHSYLGRVDGKSADQTEKDIVDMLNASRFETSYEANIMGLIWDKLLVNVGINPLTALLEVKNGELLEISEAEKSLELLVSEGEQVARSSGISLPHTDPVEYVKSIAQKTKDNRSSMLQDMSRGGKTEIDYINGAIVKQGGKVNCETKYNQLIVHLIKAKEKAVKDH